MLLRIRNKKIAFASIFVTLGGVAVGALCFLGYSEVKTWLLELVQQCVLSVEQFASLVVHYDAWATVAAWTLLVVGLCLAVWVVFSTLIRTARVQSMLRVSRVHRLNLKGYSGVVYELKDPRVFAMTVGLFRPRVYISSRLMSLAGRQVLNAIIIHELSHVKNYDNIRALGIKTMQALFFFLPAVRVWAHNRLVGFELRCDADAAACVGRRALVEAWLQCSGQEQPYAEALYFSYINDRVASASLARVSKKNQIISVLIGGCLLWGLAMPWVGYGESRGLSLSEFVQSGALVQGHCISGEIFNTLAIPQSFQMSPL